MVESFIVRMLMSAEKSTKRSGLAGPPGFCLMQHKVSHYLSFLKGIISGIIWGTSMGVIKEDTRSLDYSSSDYFRCFE